MEKARSTEADVVSSPRIRIATPDSWRSSGGGVNQNEMGCPRISYPSIRGDLLLGNETGRLRGGHVRAEVIAARFSLIAAFGFLTNQIREHGAGCLIFFRGACATHNELN
jgi:hypothetical protein